MGTWSSEAPTLPSGSEWSAISGKERTYYESYKYYLQIQFARLEGTAFAIKITITGEAGTAGTTWWNNTSIICMAYINGTLDSKASGFKGPASKTSSSVFYYSGDANEGDIIKITLKGHSGAYSTAVQTYTATAVLDTTPEKIGTDRAILDVGLYYILDTNFVPIAPFERYSSFIWTDRYDEAGDFEIETTPDPEILELLKVDNYILNTKSEHEMIIEKLVITTDIDESPKLVVSGSSLESILKRRIVWNTTNIAGNLQDGIQKLINENFISPTDEDRKISNFAFQKTDDAAITKLELTEEYDKSNTVYDILVDVCEANEIGFKVTRNLENQFVFTLYAGKDHSYDQTENAFVLFSPKFDNLRNSEYTKDAIDSVNTMLVVGGSDSDTLVLGSYTGLARREGYFSAGSMSDGYSGTMQDYLKEKGKEEMKEKKMEEKFEGEADITGLFKLGADFGLGDIVEFENEYSMRDKVRVTEIIYSEDDSGHIVYPTFEAYEPEEKEEESTTT